MNKKPFYNGKDRGKLVIDITKLPTKGTYYNFNSVTVQMPNESSIIAFEYIQKLHLN